MDNLIQPDLHMPTEIFINYNILDEIGTISAKFGKRAIIITTTTDFEKYNKTIEKITHTLQENRIQVIINDELTETPNTEEIDKTVNFLKKTRSDLVIGVGGIESINAAKAISLLLSNFLFSYDLLENPKNLAKPVNLITIPTYPILGFEICPTLHLNEIHQLSKQIYYNYDLFPNATIVDPNLSLITEDEKLVKMSICSLAIATESIISQKSNEIINTYALKTIDLIFKNLPTILRNRENNTMRYQLSLASLMAGITFSTAYLSTSLAISLAIASRTDISLENSMTVILPHIMEYNLTSSPGKYVQMSKVMGENVKDITVIEAAIKAVEGIRKLLTELDIPQKLSYYNISKSDFKEIAKLTVNYPFIKNAPRDINESEVETILISSF